MPALDRTRAVTDWDGPLGLPRFDAIGDDDYAPAFDAALEAHDREIEAIAATPDTAEFRQFIVPLELAGSRCRGFGPVLEPGRRPHQRDDPGAGTRDRAENVAALFGDRAEPATVRPHRCASGRSREAARADDRTEPRAGAPLEGFRARRRAMLDEAEQTGLAEINERLAALGARVRPERPRRRGRLAPASRATKPILRACRIS